VTATQRPRRAVNLAPSQRPELRTPLRLVLPDDLSPHVRRRRARLLVVAAGLLTALTLFGVATAHVLLAQEQFRLAKLQTQAAAEQSRNEQLKLEVAQLESPERIVAAAQERLGMVTPPTITYLAPGESATKLRSAPATVPAPVNPQAGSTPAPGSTTPTSPTSQQHTTTSGAAAGGSAHSVSTGAAIKRP